MRIPDLVLGALAALVPAELPDPAQDAAPAPVRYSIIPYSGEERVELRISVELRGSADGTTLIRLPDDYYGTPGMSEFVSDLTVSAGV